MAAGIGTQHDASSSDHRCTYDAFLSFRGADTRKGFTDHLYKALELAGIHTFRDDDEIERGANVEQELHKAIHESRVSIVVFSEDYASSRWCLDELVNIMNRKEANEQHMVMPIFYDVDPSDVRNQTGSFEKAFAGHQQRFADEMDKVEKWRRALKGVADLGGMVLGHRYESEFIQDIVEQIAIKLDYAWNRRLRVDHYLVGIDYRVKDLNMWLEDRSDDVGVAVIYGMGGIGKTTIAKTAYNQNFYKFEASSFLADIRETSGPPDGLVRLYRNLLSDIQKGKKENLYSQVEGITKIKRVVRCKRVLIVLDDVDNSDQFNSILEMREWFHPGSKIVITTRDQNLLNGHEVCAQFEIEGLDEYKSLELFSWHVFKKPHPIEEYMDLSRPLVQHCGGVPLALQVLGASLVGKTKELWKIALQNLDVITEGKIQKVLRISFDSLQDHEKRLFLHIACFFIGKDRDYTTTVLDECHFATKIGIQNLVYKCLVRVNEDNKLIMHQLLSDMGRGIIRDKSPEDPGKRSRVWQKDASNVLRKLTGTKAIKGLMLNFSSTDLSLVLNEVIFKTEAFRKMKNLELLLLDSVKFSGSYEDFPKNVTWLSWRGFPLTSIPADLCLENLAGLDLRKSSLQYVWGGAKSLPCLKILNLSHSHGLKATPDMSEVPNLERLILKDCINLVRVDESIGNLGKLVFLNLKDCKNLVKLPTRMSMLKSLQDLILTGCSKLMLHDTTSAIHLLSTDSDMKARSILSTITWTPILSWWMRLLPRRNLQPTSFSLAELPRSLGRLSLSYCNQSVVPDDINTLPSLKYLDLSSNPIMSLPEKMKRLTMLETLVLNGCKKLRMLPELPPSLEELEANYCTSLERVTNLPNLFTSLDAYFGDCARLAEVEGLVSIKPLRSVDIEMRKYMGLNSLESVGSADVDVKMYNYLTDTIRKGPVQVLYECGIYTTFLPGSKIPDGFEYTATYNSVISVTLPSRPNLKIQGLNACVLYWEGDALINKPLHSVYNLLKVSNQTKGRTWIYSPLAYGLPTENDRMVWLSHVRFGNNELEGGDEILISVQMVDYLIHEFGIQIVYETETKGKLGVEPNAVAGDVSTSASKYELWVGKYFLCNHNCDSHQEQWIQRGENPAPLEYSNEPELGLAHLFKD